VGHSRLASPQAMINRLSNKSALLRQMSSENMRLRASKLRTALRRGEVLLPLEQSKAITDTLLQLERIISVRTNTSIYIILHLRIPL
jgi:hypothetical protein